MRNIVALHPHGQRLHAEDFTQLFDSPFRAQDFALVLSAVFCHSVVGVGVRKVKKLSSHALLWFNDSNRMRGECGHCAFKACHIFHVVRDDFVRKRWVVDVVLIDV